MQDNQILSGIPAVVICGPTAIGKTRLALELANRIPIEVVSADSRQIYRFMDIGTGTPCPKEMSRVPHHLISILSPDESFSAADFARDALSIIRAIYGRGSIPVVVGGTFLYLKALLFGFFDAPGRSPAVRQRLSELAESRGSAALHDELTRIDPITAQSIHPNDQVRLIRALEVCETSGRTVSELKRIQQESDERPIAPVIFALSATRDKINPLIDARVELMFKNGFVDEVKHLLKAGYDPSLNSLSGLGYREVMEFLSGKMTLNDAINATKMRTRRYAKKQLQWMKQDWGFEFLDAEEFESNVNRVLSSCKSIDESRLRP